MKTLPYSQRISTNKIRAWYPKNKYLAYAGDDGKIYILYYECGQCHVNTILGYDSDYQSCTYHKNSSGQSCCWNCGNINGINYGSAWVQVINECEHCQGSGVGWDWTTYKEVQGGCTRCGGTGSKAIE